MADTTVIGLAVVKINGTFHLDVKNARFSVKRADTMHQTGAGNRQAIGLPVPSGSFDEVIPRNRALDWRALKDFSIDILDREGKTILASFDVCNWTDISVSADLGSANTTKAISWVGSEAVKY